MTVGTLDIDTPKSTKNLAIKLFVMDVDGVMTDGKIIYHSDGSESKAFFVQDGIGIKRLASLGVKIAIITGRQSQIVARRADELDIDFVIQGRDDKLVALQQLCQSIGVVLDECAYIGDDLPDLPAIQVVKIGFAPANAVDAVKAVADVVTMRQGGAGAVREACDYVATLLLD